jgi:hypothetical protein
MKKSLFLSIVFAITLAGSAIPSKAQTAKSGFRILTPGAGSVLKGGQRIQVKWDVRLDRTISENPYGEIELYLETIEGAFMRITPQLGPSSRTFDWTVPSINSRGARLLLKAGVEGEGDPYNFAQDGTFYINSDSRRPAILLNSMRERTKPGTDMEVTWTSNLEPGTNFDVMVSYDRGAHFFKAGSTVGNGFVLPVEEDFAGTITIQIVSRRADGTAIRSLLTGDATVRIRDDGDR